MELCFGMLGLREGNFVFDKILEIRRGCGIWSWIWVLGSWGRGELVGWGCRYREGRMREVVEGVGDGGCGNWDLG